MGSFLLTWEGLGDHFRVILAVLAVLEVLVGLFFDVETFVLFYLEMQ